MVAERDLRNDRGVTLIELLVALAIIGLLLALTIPAVLGARESARRTWCASNLRTIALASQQYEFIYNSLPPGRMKTYDPRYRGDNPPCTSRFIDKGPLIFILPFLEQSPLHSSINQNTSVFAAENTTVHSVVVAGYACPSDGFAGFAQQLDPAAMRRFRMLEDGGKAGSMVFTSYGGSMGSIESLALPLPQYQCRVAPTAIVQNNGCFCDVSPINSAAITDGLSNTILWLERSTAAVSRSTAGENVYLRFGWYVSGNWGDSVLSTFYPPNPQGVIAPAAVIARFHGASSSHPGGLNVAMADGSVRFVQNSIDSWLYSPYTGRPIGIVAETGGWWSAVPRSGLWQQLATRAGGEPVVD